MKQLSLTILSMIFATSAGAEQRISSSSCCIYFDDNSPSESCEQFGDVVSRVRDDIKSPTSSVLAPNASCRISRTYQLQREPVPTFTDGWLIGTDANPNQYPGAAVSTAPCIFTADTQPLSNILFSIQYFYITNNWSLKRTKGSYDPLTNTLVVEADLVCAQGNYFPF
jgi:hypothetical protein